MQRRRRYQRDRTVFGAPHNPEAELQSNFDCLTRRLSRRRDFVVCEFMSGSGSAATR
jgi:hypothetical protein